MEGFNSKGPSLASENGLGSVSDADPTRVSGFDREEEDASKETEQYTSSPATNLEIPSVAGSPATVMPSRPRSRDFEGHRPRPYEGRFQNTPVAPRAPSPVRTEYGADDNDDLASVRTDMTTRTMKANRPQPVTKSKKIGQIQNIFTESQKIAYVGLCYLSIVHFRSTRLHGMKKAMQAYDEWAKKFMERLYIYLDVLDEGEAISLTSKRPM